MKIFKSNQKGFTLIELLVVVAIISLLSSVVLASLREAREKAKNSAFRQEMNQFINALELYRTDKGAYPPNYIGRYTNNTIVSNGQLNQFYPYLPTLPKAVSPVANSENLSWKYGSFTINEYVCLPKNTPASYEDGELQVKPSPYIIMTYDALSVMNDWGYLYFFDNGTYGFQLDPDNGRCFSLN